MTYQEALDYIASLAPRGWRLGLDRMRAFVQRAGLEGSLGEPGGPQFIHVAGTNGKGSVTAFLQSILAETCANSGAYFSPYVFDPRERVQFGRDMISEGELARLTGVLRPVAEAFTETDFGGITEFEFKTALALLAYKERACEVVALEVGLGGRLDATNVVTPLASAIVSIGLDHTQILGNTHAEIAREKAGIIKLGKPVVAGQMPAEALAEIERAAAEAGSEIWRVGREVRTEREGNCHTVCTPRATYTGLRPGIPGLLQDQNMAVALAAFDASALSATPDQIQEGVAQAFLPGRMQQLTWHGRRFILDGAHNADAARVLLPSVRAFMKGGRLLLVTNMVAGHDPASFYQEIAPAAAEAHVVPIDFHRALPPDEVAAALKEFISAVNAHHSVESGLLAAAENAQAGDLILVTGSFYLVGEAGRLMMAPGTRPQR